MKNKLMQELCYRTAGTLRFAYYKTRWRPLLNWYLELYNRWLFYKFGPANSWTLTDK